MGKIKILLADDHTVLRAGLKALLSAQPDIQVIAEASNGIETVQKARDTNPDIVLMDISMPGLTGLEATQHIKKFNPEIKVLVLTMHEDANYLYRMLRAGASGYVTKKAADTELLDAIRATQRGEHFIQSSMTSGLISELQDKKAPHIDKIQGNDKLSQREIEVLRLLALGHTNQEVADKLYLSVKTVETYKSRIKEKLGVQGRAELVRYAIQSGIMDKET